MKHLQKYILIALSIIVGSYSTMAQDYYDDIYGAPPRQKQQAQKQTTPSYQVADYPAADSYTTPAGTLEMSVDEYNRRGQFLVSDSVATDSLGLGDTFAYTRRIEKYHNPDIITESGDTTLCDYYYSTPQTTNVNVYVMETDPWYPYSWAWRYGSPWYWNVYGPAYIGWSSYWNPWWYDPYPWGWSWGWTWSPGWGGWGPGWGGWHPGWGPSVAWRPATPSAGRPHPATGGSVSPNRGHGYATNSGYNRPGNMGRPTGGNVYTPGSRPGASGIGTTGTTARPGTRPNASQGTYTPYGTGTRGRNSSGVSNSGSSRSTYNSGSNNGSRNTYNNNSNRNTNNNSRGSYNSGSRGSFGGGGGSHSTRGGGSSGHGSGGGGGRGRR